MKSLLSVIVYPQYHWSGCSGYNLAQFLYRYSTKKLHLTSAFRSNKNIRNHSLFLLELTTDNILGKKDVFLWILFSKLLYVCFVLMGREVEDLRSN